MSLTKLGSIDTFASMDNWDDLINFSDKYICQHIQDKGRQYKLKLAFEELVSNILRAASENDRPSKQQVKLTCIAYLGESDGEDWLIIETQDSGNHFDPCFAERVPVNTKAPIEERQIGGLGLYLIKESVDKVRYEWLNQKNVYQLWMATNFGPN